MIKKASPKKNPIEELKAKLSALRSSIPDATAAKKELSRANQAATGLRAKIASGERQAKLAPIVAATAEEAEAVRSFTATIGELKAAWSAVEDVLERSEEVRQSIVEAREELAGLGLKVHHLLPPVSFYANFAKMCMLDEDSSPGRIRRGLTGMRYLRARIREGSMRKILAMFPDNYRYLRSRIKV